MAKFSNQQNIHISNSKKVRTGDIIINASGAEEAFTTPEQQAKSESIQKLIAAGDEKSALDEMLVFFKDRKKIYEECLLLLSRMNRIETENRLGIVSQADKNLEINKISKAMLELLGIDRV